jgi:hypothetical protein
VLVSTTTPTVGSPSTRTGLRAVPGVTPPLAELIRKAKSYPYPASIQRLSGPPP